MEIIRLRRHEYAKGAVRPEKQKSARRKCTSDFAYKVNVVESENLNTHDYKIGRKITPKRNKVKPKKASQSDLGVLIYEKLEQAHRDQHG